MSDWLHKIGHAIENVLHHEDAPPAAPTAAPPAPAPSAPAAPAAASSRSAMDVRAALGRTERGGPDEREFMESTDGFVAFDPASGALAGGRLPGARTRAELLPGHSNGLLEILAHGDSRNPVTFRVGASGPAVSGGKTNHDGDATLPASALAGAFAGVNPRRGGLVPVRGSPMGSVQANVLALPKDYDGPIFVSDIDDTLRDTSIGDVIDGKLQPPIPGAKEILSDAAAQGVPIVYLSAGTSAIRAQNRRFLEQMPAGVLLDKKDYGVKDLDPRNAAQAKLQAEYKTAVLQELRKAYPNAKIFGLGDDKYGDAMAYTSAGAKAYIHDVREGDANVPGRFAGTLTKDWDVRVRAQIHADLASAIAGSKSFR